MPPWPFSSGSSKPSTPPTRLTPNPPDGAQDYFSAYSYSDAPLHDAPLFDFEDLQPPAPPFAGTSRTHHARSISNTLFGSSKNKASSAGDTLSRSSPSPADGFLDGANSPKRKPARGKAEDDEPETGTCATCNTTVKWPKGKTSEFRCTTCQMVNNLRPLQQKSSSPSGKGLAPRPDPDSGATASHRAHVSLDQTRAIIDRCIDSYLQTRIARRAQAKGTSIHTPPRSPTKLSAPAFPPPTASSDKPPSTESASNVHPPTFSEDVNLAWAVANDQKLTTSETKDERNAVSGGNGYLAADHRVRRSNSYRRDFKFPDTLPARPKRKAPPPPAPFSTLAEPAGHRRPVPSSLHAPKEGALLESSRAPWRNSEEEVQVLSNKAIFKPLEEYIMQSFANHDYLNCSFATTRPRARRSGHSDELLRGRHLRPANDPPTPAEASISELDAKTLLLGDVAENGLWWTGRDLRTSSAGRRAKQEKPTDHTTDIVHSRSPRINWHEVSTWYRLVIRVGDHWRQRCTELKDSGALDTADSASLLDDADDIEVDLVQARVHVQRTLLKASETILKRPGRPLKTPNDTRFLLILLANPLAYPTSSSPLLSLVSKDLASAREAASPVKQSTREGPRHVRSASGRKNNPGYWEQGQAFGIIKRLFGLMSNLPNDCHRFITSWFSRYNEKQFRMALDMIQAFITYRLGRQHRTRRSDSGSAPSDLIPHLSGTGTETSAQLHAALGLGSQSRSPGDGRGKPPPYSDDWQIRSAARVMSLLFVANKNFHGERIRENPESDSDPTSISRQDIKYHGQLISTSQFYNLKASYADLVADFETWETSYTKFALCQYPFLLSVSAKIRIMEHDARRQMDSRAREAFFGSLYGNRAVQQYVHLKVRRDCLIEDSLTSISEVVAQGQEEIKKGLRVQFSNEEGIDAGGLRKEWFLLLVREVFDPNHGMFIYDEDSKLCYFNPYSFETSDQYFLVGAVLGLAIYNLTILDVAFPPFIFRKLLAAGPSQAGHQSHFNRTPIQYTLDDLAEYRPALAKGLRQLLEYDGNVEETFCRDFVAEVDRYGSIQRIPLCNDGENRPVTNANRQEFVDLYIRFLLDTQVSRQFEPFKRGFFTVCEGNALSLFQPEEIELLIRGSDESLDVQTLKAVAVYENWQQGDRKIEDPAENIIQLKWFWDFFESADPKDQRKLLSFITGSDRIPAMGAASLIIKVGYAGKDSRRFPIARTCFNSILLYKYRSRDELVSKLWRAVCESEGFGLK